MSTEPHLTEIETPTYHIHLTAISLQGGSIAVSERGHDAGISGAALGSSDYFSLSDLHEHGYPTAGDPRTNAVAWYLNHRLIRLSQTLSQTGRRFKDVEIWLCDQIVYGFLIDELDVMQACIHDLPKNQAMRELLTTLALLRNRDGVNFKFGYIKRESHPTYSWALGKIPQNLKVIPTLAGIRKQGVRILEGEAGLMELGDKGVIGGNNLLLKTEHKHHVPQEKDDLDFLAKLDDSDFDLPETPKTDDMVDTEDPVPVIPFGLVTAADALTPVKGRRRDSTGKTSLEFFSYFQTKFGVFQFLEKMGIKFYGRFRDQDTPNPIERTEWRHLRNPRISVYWGGSFGHKVGNFGPFGDFQEAVRHVLNTIGLNPKDFLIPMPAHLEANLNHEDLFAGIIPEFYDGSTLKDQSYVLVETVRGLVTSSNLLKGKEGLSVADVTRLEESIRTKLQEIATGAKLDAPTAAIDEELQGEPKAETVDVGYADDPLRKELEVLETKLKGRDEKQDRLDYVEDQLQNLNHERDELEEELKGFESLVARRDRIRTFLGD